MRGFVLIPVLLCTAAAQPNPGSASIEGRVANSATGSAIRKVSVTLVAPNGDLVADTDGNGRFQFTGLPPGTYKLTASHHGFFDHSSRPISLKQDDHATGTVIDLVPQGTISGRVLDEDGDPVPDAKIFAFKERYRDGRAEWIALSNGLEALFGTIRTNENGEYRVSGLRPGKYVVRAENTRPTPNSQYGAAAKEVYLPTYYPDAATQQAALPIDVGTGAPVSGIDVHLSKRPVLEVARFRVKGKVTGMADPDASVWLILSPADGSPGGVSSPVPGPDHEFDFQLPAGEYNALASEINGPEAYARRSLTLAGDMTGVDLGLVLSPPRTAQVSIIEQDNVAVKLEGVKVVLNPLSPGNTNKIDGETDAGGKVAFTQMRVQPSRYAVSVPPETLPEGCYLETVKFAGQELPADGFDSMTAGPIEIVLSHKAATVTGTVLDDQEKPFAGATLTLIASNGQSLPRKATAGDDGSFKLTGLRPGTYRLFAWEEVDDDVWQDPDFLKKHEVDALPVTVGPSETQTVQPHVIVTRYR